MSKERIEKLIREAQSILALLPEGKMADGLEDSIAVLYEDGLKGNLTEDEISDIEMEIIGYGMAL